MVETMGYALTLVARDEPFNRVDHSTSDDIEWYVPTLTMPDTHNARHSHSRTLAALVLFLSMGFGVGAISSKCPRGAGVVPDKALRLLA